ncbi:DUF2231 domain-containing protein [Staphylococcus hyicus]|uniref:DUF2231 domain-containing protein n=1 Tax=Staphylococcus hyicus TaxID=1284 RepID=A0ACD5FPR1_STAHY|nr:DUF2231 domain-containing protein [Staphylococcus hyicus]MDP4463675.1 hypothetical protein [Staphylococcus hyicus]
MPLHPLFVHFPIALLSFATLIALLNVIFKKKDFSFSLALLLIFGMLSGVMSYLLGDSGEEYAMQHFNPQHVESLVHLHETFAMLSLIAYGLATVFHLGGMWFKAYATYSKWGVLIFTIIGFGLLIVAGHLGASITYGN